MGLWVGEKGVVLEVFFPEIASQPPRPSPPFPGSEVLGKGLTLACLPSEPQSRLQKGRRWGREKGSELMFKMAGAPASTYKIQTHMGPISELLRKWEDHVGARGYYQVVRWGN